MTSTESYRLRFLNDAADLLNLRSPSTSAYLLGVHTHILHENHKSLHVRQHKQHCGGCGTLRQGRSKTTLISPKDSKCRRGLKPESKFKSKSGSGSGSTEGAIVYKCQRCNQRVVLPRKASTKTLRVAKSSSLMAEASTSSFSSTDASNPRTTASASLTTAELPKNDNANSKKRAKARKQGSLAALLASKKIEQPSLDLLDFLQ